MNADGLVAVPPGVVTVTEPLVAPAAYDGGEIATDRLPTALLRTTPVP